MTKKLTRRAFIGALAAGAAAAPFALPLRSRGAIGFPKRLVVFAAPNGTVMNEFWPGDGCGTFGRILRPLEPYRAKLSVLRGLDSMATAKEPIPRDHWPDFYNALIARQPLGNGESFRPAGISIDQAIANEIGGETRFASLQLGVNTRSYCGILSAAGAERPLPPENDPFAVFDRLFAGSMDSREADRIRLERRSILDAVRGDLAATRCRLGGQDRERFDIHLESIREIERGLGAAAASCLPPDLGPSFSISDRSNYPRTGQAQMDCIAAALRCDLTRVVTLQWSEGASRLAHPWADAPSYSHHGISHNSEGVTASENDRREWLIRISTWYAEQLAYLLGKLEETPEGDGTLLDHTAVLWLHEQSNGANHQRTDLPYVLAGSCGGALRTGQCRHFGGRSHSALLVTLANAMGVEMDSFGDEDFATRALSELLA